MVLKYNRLVCVEQLLLWLGLQQRIKNRTPFPEEVTGKPKVWLLRAPVPQCLAKASGASMRIGNPYLRDFIRQTPDSSIY